MVARTRTPLTTLRGNMNSCGRFADEAKERADVLAIRRGNLNADSLGQPTFGARARDAGRPLHPRPLSSSVVRDVCRQRLLAPRRRSPLRQWRCCVLAIATRSSRSCSSCSTTRRAHSEARHSRTTTSLIIASRSRFRDTGSGIATDLLAAHFRTILSRRCFAQRRWHGIGFVHRAGMIEAQESTISVAVRWGQGSVSGDLAQSA